jgi:hypothetical protein
MVSEDEMLDYAHYGENDDEREGGYGEKDDERERGKEENDDERERGKEENDDDENEKQEVKPEREAKETKKDGANEEVIWEDHMERQAFISHRRKIKKVTYSGNNYFKLLHSRTTQGN